MVLAEIKQFERGAAEFDLAAAVIDDEVGNDDVRPFALLDQRLGILVGDEDGAEVLERLAAGDVVEMAVAVDHVADGRLGDLADLADIGGRRGPALADRIGGDDAVGRDDEHRLMALITEHVDVVGAGDLGGREQRRCRGLGVRGQSPGTQKPGKQYGCKTQHG